MCGRFTMARDLLGVTQRFAAPVTELAIKPRYNIAPSQKVPVIIRKKPAQSELIELTWGFLPPWSTPDKKMMMVNIRAETLFNRPAFKKYLDGARCLIPADGFYEWKDEGKVKRPFHFTVNSGLFGIAGIYCDDTFCLITTESNSVVASVHHRMPVIIPRSREDAWLNPDSKPSDYTPILAPYNPEEMKAHEVSTRVNSGKVEDPELIKPVS